jgi:hypothetical protein
MYFEILIMVKSLGQIWGQISFGLQFFFNFHKESFSKDKFVPHSIVLAEYFFALGKIGAK